ncbi:hypothetical protein ACH5RR_024805 [Cinchona calisaya]|uniref:Uncharacterized protein n=1 Tax=Cinchona calisaya TaxID=153742 RepID=A0ABD2Z2V7_9GENT
MAVHDFISVLKLKILEEKMALWIVDDLEAIAALKESVALEFSQGKGKRVCEEGEKALFYSDAIDCYTRAIYPEDHVNLLLGNYRLALQDAAQINVKAFYRAVRACLL